jgi:chemotaxis response regulator CheB
VTTHDLIVAGASAGGVESLGAMVADLPGDPPAAVAAS